MHPTEALEEPIQIWKQQEKAGIVVMDIVTRFESTDSNQ